MASEQNPFLEGSYLVEEVVSCSWMESELRAVLNITRRSQSSGPSNGFLGGYEGIYVLKCDGVDILTVLEEGVADRADMLVIENAKPVFSGLAGFDFSEKSKRLDNLKDGQDSGEYVSHKAMHFVVRSLYNSFEFFSSLKPSLGVYRAD